MVLPFLLREPCRGKNSGSGQMGWLLPVLDFQGIHLLFIFS